MAQQVLATLIMALCLSWASAAFNCSLYASTCSGTPGYTAYSDCSDTVAANPNMTCRAYHLGVAATADNAIEHCPHAAQDATGPCVNETLKSFNCSLYASTCSGTPGYKAYTGCSDTVKANPLGMVCRTYHLGVAATGGNADTHCPHAAQDATGPCATETLKSFNCSLYASTCSATAGYKAYTGCSDTVKANPLGMVCRTYHLGVAATADNAETHCPHAAQDATGPCATETLKSFNCSLYASTCSGTPGYKAYAGCSDTVKANPLGMVCRTYHLGVAATANNAETHCPHAAQDATGPCATETLKSFNCSLYASTCSETAGYKAYADCSATVAANPLGMVCRTYHLGVAAKPGNAMHCPNAAENATGPCAAEVLSVGVPTSTTSRPTATMASGESRLIPGMMMLLSVRGLINANN
ncbi:unnamed protein product [Polarella glacialis]|uniref:Secreted protein n=1 Tax=Polarella glacialis TaxID=89957 RepID=A0A813GZG5_POLGL|nr:unnamed protein product [Polarella glacialis]